MLKFCKSILEKVSFDPILFKKELSKSTKWLTKTCLVFFSCQEENPTRAIITVTTPDGAPAYDGAQSCKVILSQQGQINTAGNESNVYKKDYTSSNGSVEFEFVNEAILNIDVEYTTGNDVYTAESVIKLVREELVRKTVVVN